MMRHATDTGCCDVCLADVQTGRPLKTMSLVQAMMAKPPQVAGLDTVTMDKLSKCV